jgi:hypothetical protein
LEHLSAVNDISAGVGALDRLSKPRRVDEKTVKGINFFDPVDNALLHALQDPGVNIAVHPACRAAAAAATTLACSSVTPAWLAARDRRYQAGERDLDRTRIGRHAAAAVCKSIPCL